MAGKKLKSILVELVNNKFLIRGAGSDLKRFFNGYESEGEPDYFITVTDEELRREEIASVIHIDGVIGLRIGIHKEGVLCPYRKGRPDQDKHCDDQIGNRKIQFTDIPVISHGHYLLVCHKMSGEAWWRAHCISG